MPSHQSFADRLQASIERSKSVIVAGLDPRLEDLPEFIIQKAKNSYKDRDEVIFNALSQTYKIALEVLRPHIAAVKPNSAFFEQYGLAGIKAFAEVLECARSHSLPIIADVKRGDIGSTASAYSTAYLAKFAYFGEKFSAFEADAITVNPFLGFDTLEVFLKDCIEYKKGIFVLVKTSNPGSADLQSSISEKIADWLSLNAALLMGQCGLSGLGAVVGATYPGEAKDLRARMPHNIFLVPGFGAQGGSAKDSTSGFIEPSLQGGGIINISRALFGNLLPSVTSEDDFVKELLKRVLNFKQEIFQVLK